MIVPLIVLSATSFLFINYTLTSDNSSSFVNSTVLRSIESRGQDLETLDIRLERFKESIETVLKHPVIILGLYDEKITDYNVVYFHNEYLSIFMLGGVISLFLYIAYISFLIVHLFKQRKISILAKAALFILIGNLIQGFSVTHFQPGFLFLFSTGLSVIFYRAGLSSREHLGAHRL